MKRILLSPLAMGLAFVFACQTQNVNVNKNANLNTNANANASNQVVSPSMAPTSCTGQMFGCSTVAAARASR